MKFAGGSRLRARAAVAAVAATFCACAVEAADVNCTRPCTSYPCDIEIILTSQADADAWGTCGNITGNIIVQSDNITNITLTGFETILDGNLVVGNCSQLIAISAPALTSIWGNFTLSNLPLLTDVEFPLLESVGDSLIWNSLPLLEYAAIGTEVSLADFYDKQKGYESFSLVNTSLHDIDFFPRFTYNSNVNLIQIEDNPNLYNLNLSGLNGATVIEIRRNGPAATLLLPNMEGSNKISISDIGSIDISSFSSQGSGSLEFSNNSFSTLSMPELFSTSGSLYIVDNPLLDRLSIPYLNQIGAYAGWSAGDFVVMNNPQLQSLVLPRLLFTTGSMNLTGDFSTVSFPEMNQNPRSFLLNSTNPGLNCTPFDENNYEYLVTNSEETNKTLPSSYFYSCSSYPPGSTKDVAQHYQKPKKPLSQPAKVVIIIVGVVLGLLIIGGAGRWYNKKYPTTQPEQRRQAGQVVTLEDVSGGVVRAEEDGDYPPKYARVGRPGEVPPGYDESLDSSREADAQDANTESLPTNEAAGGAPVPKRGFWRLFRYGPGGK